ncbi:hypothetical protein I4U23_021841 [Adineta vaga]|nr:hypothetical protein I4U23_021841 [Adineta vaga]
MSIEFKAEKDTDSLTLVAATVVAPEHGQEVLSFILTNMNDHKTVKSAQMVMDYGHSGSDDLNNLNESLLNQQQQQSPTNNNRTSEKSLTHRI